MHEWQPATGQISCAQYKKMETVPDEEVEKREQLMHDIFGEVICDLNNNRKKASKGIVFCFLQNACAMIYNFF